MTYLTRPVFEFDVNWSDSASKSFTFDLRELLIGFGAEFFSSLQSHVTQGWELSLMLKDADEIEAYESFTSLLTGRLTGFWLPTPFNALQVAAPVDTTHFDIVDQNLRDTLSDHPDVYFWVNGQPCKITAVALQSPGIERVTLDAAIAQPAAGDRVQRLHYVRLADDVEKGTFLKENTLPMTVRVIELPLEYAAFETGERPIYLYHFWTAAPMDWHWRYTSFAADVVSGNKLFAKYPITHSTVKDSTRPENRTLEIIAKDDPSHPFSLYFPIPFSRPLFVEVQRVEYADLDTARTLFSGQVRKVPPGAGDKITAQCDDWLGILSRKILKHTIGPECDYQVYEPHTCKVLRANFETVGVIEQDDGGSLRPPVYIVALLYQDSAKINTWKGYDYFTGGFLEVGHGLHFEVRTILRSATVHAPGDPLFIYLNAPLVHAAVGDRVQLIPGCNGLAATCRDKFHNFDEHFGGEPDLPEKNLTLKAGDAVASQGDKK